MGWSDSTRLGGILISPPTVAHSLQNGTPGLTCFAVGIDCSIYGIDIIPEANATGPWYGIGGRLSPNCPGAAVEKTGFGLISLFAIGTDSVVYLAQSGSQSSLGKWQDLGGNWVRGVSAIVKPGVLECFTVGTNGSLYHRIYGEISDPLGGPTRPGWNDWENLGGTLISAPAAVSWGAARADVFALGVDGNMFHKNFDSGSDWSDWSRPFDQGIFIHSPAVASPGVDRLDVFGVGLDSTIYHGEWDGQSWSALENIEGPPPSGLTITSPAAIATKGPAVGQCTVALFAIGTDGVLNYKKYSP